MGCGASNARANGSHDDMGAVGPTATATARPDQNTNDAFADGFCFGDNTGATTLNENDQDVEKPAERNRVQSLMNVPPSRREGVSADPILPDAAEHFVPHVVKKSPDLFTTMCQTVKRSPLFASLDPEDLKVVVGAMEEERFSKGTVVLEQGKPGTDKFYFIQKGIVDILKLKEGYICSFTDGQTFGELELMYLSPCAASVVCKTDVHAFSIDRDTYRHIVMMVSIRKRKQHIAYLQQVAFLGNMNNYELTTLADAMETKYFEKGEKLISFGSPGDYMFVVMSGSVEVIGRDQASGKSVKVCTFDEGEIIGELEFLNHHKAVADVVAVNKVKTGSLHREHFEACMGPVKDFLRHNAEENTKYQYYNTITHDDGQGNKLLDFKFGDGGEDPFGAGGGAFNSAFGGFGDDNGEINSQDEGSSPPPPTTKVRKQGVSDDVIEEDSSWEAPTFKKSENERELLFGVLKENPLFRSLEKHDFDVVVSAMERHTYKDGTLILEQGGEGGSHLHVIEEGTVEIIRNQKLIVTFGRGQGFGEMELMYYQPCVATVKARGEVVTWALDRTTYKRLVMQISIKRRNLYTELLGGVEFLDRMSEYEKGQLADALTPVTFKKGESIIRRGERNEWMYIIVSGKVEVLGVPEGAQCDDMEIAATRHICFLERGACVGELEFLNQHSAVANCVAFDDVRACTLHRDHFELCMGPIMDVLRKTVRQDKYEYYNNQLEDMRAPSHQRSGVHAGPNTRRARTHAVSAETAEKEDGPFEAPKIAKDAAQLEICSQTVRKCPLFSGLTGEDRQVVIDALEPTSLPAGHMIFTEGHVPEDNHWYIVSQGTVEQVREHNHVVATFSAGQSFGELELMYTTPAQVTTRVSSSGDMKGFRLDRRTYRRIVMQVVEERRRLYRELLTGVPFAAALTEQQHVVLADALTPIHFSPGDHLIRIGEQAEWMYILVDGVVEVFGKDGAKVCDLRRGEMVGELEFLNKHSAVANCIAKTHVQACKLHRDHFEMCLGPVTDYIQKVLEKPKYSYYKSTVKK